MTSSGGLGFSDEERILPHTILKPDMGTFDAGSMNFYKGVFLNPPLFLEKLGAAYIENGIKPEVEVFDAGMVWNAKRLLKDGFLKAPIHFQCCMHVHGGMEGTAKNLVLPRRLAARRLHLVRVRLRPHRRPHHGHGHHHGRPCARRHGRQRLPEQGRARQAQLRVRREGASAWPPSSTGRSPLRPKPGRSWAWPRRSK